MSGVTIIERKTIHGMHLVLATVKCMNCPETTPERWFYRGEPLVGLCDRCAAGAVREDYGNVAKGHRPVKEMRYVAGECVPGESSGKVRKSMSYGDAENANGLWDNLVRELEG